METSFLNCKIYIPFNGSQIFKWLQRIMARQRICRLNLLSGLFSRDRTVSNGQSVRCSNSYWGESHGNQIRREKMMIRVHGRFTIIDGFIGRIVFNQTYMISDIRTAYLISPCANVDMKPMLSDYILRKLKMMMYYYSTKELYEAKLQCAGKLSYIVLSIYNSEFATIWLIVDKNSTTF